MSALRVADPIYDVVFKALMEDLEVARGIISRLTGMTILDLQPRVQEHTHQFGVPQKPKPPGSAAGDAANASSPELGAIVDGALGLKREQTMWIYRVDYVAEVRFADGITRKVAIELQKSQVHMNLHRFRGYLAMRYAEGSRGAAKDTPLLPVLPIYLLGFSLPKWLPKVIATERVYRDGLTGQVILPPASPDKDDAWAVSGRAEFIEMLTHDGRFIQLRHPDYDPMTEVGGLLALFDQRRANGHRHFIEVDDAFEARMRGDAFLSRMLRILQRSSADEETLRLMDLEDEVVSEFDRLETRLAESETQRQQALAEKQAAEAEKRQALEREQLAQAEKLQALERERLAHAEKQRALDEAAKLKEQLRSLGFDA